MGRSLAPVLLLLCFCCSPVDLDRFENDVSEAVFRQMFDEASLVFGNEVVAGTYFISFGYQVTAPRRSFLSRFDDLAFLIKAGGQEVASEYFLPAEGERTGKIENVNATIAMFQIAKIDQISRTAFEVEGAFLIPGQDSVRNVYSVEIATNGAPVVTGSRPYGVAASSGGRSQVEGSQQ